MKRIKANKLIYLVTLILAGFLTSCGEEGINTIQSNDPVFSMDKFEENLRASLDGATVGYVYAINLNGQLNVRHDGKRNAQYDNMTQLYVRQEARNVSSVVNYLP